MIPKAIKTKTDTNKKAAEASAGPVVMQGFWVQFIDASPSYPHHLPHPRIDTGKIENVLDSLTIFHPTNVALALPPFRTWPSRLFAGVLYGHWLPPRCDSVVPAGSVRDTVNIKAPSQSVPTSELQLKPAQGHIRKEGLAHTIYNTSVDDDQPIELLAHLGQI
jgi:hypothetical protein